MLGPLRRLLYGVATERPVTLTPVGVFRGVHSLRRSRALNRVFLESNNNFEMKITATGFVELSLHGACRALGIARTVRLWREESA